MNLVLFYMIRFAILIIAIWIAYLFVQSFIKPTILYDMCLVDTNNCTELELYQYENTFIAHEKVSQIWFWYNGDNLYIYGQNIETNCDDNYSPVNVFSLSIKGNTIDFLPFPNECVDNIDNILEYYKEKYHVTKKIYYTRKKKSNLVNNIFDIIQQMYNNKIFII